MNEPTTVTLQDEGGALAGRPATLPFVGRSPQEPISAGGVFIEKTNRLPESLIFQNGSDVAGWAALDGARSTFEKTLQEAGWTLFFMAGEVKVTVLGSGPEALRTAIERLIVKVKSDKCNALEITQVTKRHFLGVPYVSLSAHPRHLQMGLVFSGRF